MDTIRELHSMKNEKETIMILTEVNNVIGEKWEKLHDYLRCIIVWDKRFSDMQIDSILNVLEKEFLTRDFYDKGFLLNSDGGAIKAGIEFYSKRALGYTFQRPAIKDPKLEEMRRRMEKEDLEYYLEHKNFKYKNGVTV